MNKKGVRELFEAMGWIKEEFSDRVLDIVGFTEEDHEEAISLLVADNIAVFHGFKQNPDPTMPWLTALPFLATTKVCPMSFWKQLLWAEWTYHRHIWLQSSGQS